MPFLRVRSHSLPVDQKRVMAQKLIDITLHAFRLRAEERHQITIQFVSQEAAQDSDRNYADIALDVMGHDLTEDKKAAFAEETTGMINHLMPRKSGLIARLLGNTADAHRQVALQFHELSAATADSSVGQPLRRAA